MPAGPAWPAALALAILSGLLCAATFPPLRVPGVVLVALAPLVVATRGRGLVAGAALGWASGTVATAFIVVPWVAAAARDYFRQGPVVALLGGAAIAQLYGVLGTTVFGAATARIGSRRGPVLRVLGVAAAWTASELLRARAFTGAPWNLFAHAVYDTPLWLQTAELGGAYAVTFVLACVSAALAELCVAPREEKRTAVATGAIVVALALGYGALRLATLDDRGTPELRVALVQGNVPNAWRLDPRHAPEALASFVEPTRRILAERPQLVVWPENAVGFFLDPNSSLRSAVTDLLGPSGPPLLLGAPRYQQVGDGRVRLFNSAYLLAGDGTTLGIYDKRRLVPFAEYTPLRVLAGVEAPGDYSPGDTPTVLGGPEPFGVLICYEAIYASLARELVQSGARFLVNASSDTWFGHGAGVEQHFASTVFRAVETRRALVRVANAGVSAVVGPSGRVLERLPEATSEARVAAVPLRDGVTPYTRFGDAFAWLTVLATALLVLLPARTRAR